jgi:hypothetical protein
MLNYHERVFVSGTRQTSVRLTRALSGSMAVIACATALFLAAPQLHAQEHVAAASGPFGGMGGVWSGGGILRTKDGAQERLRCRGTYDVQGGGNGLRQDLRCASDSYNFQMSTDMTQSGGQLLGNWSENTRHIGGRISGYATPTTIRARADSDTFTAMLAVNTRGDRQSVSISSPGAEISEVSIALTRGR